MTTPLVSIILPTFNRLEFLRSAVDSVFSQTLTDWELIIADIDVAGAKRKVIMQLNRNAFLYVLDRTNGDLVSANAHGSELRLTA